MIIASLLKISIGHFTGFIGMGAFTLLHAAKCTPLITAYEFIEAFNIHLLMRGSALSLI